jgi:hypothetical protein
MSNKNYHFSPSDYERMFSRNTYMLNKLKAALLDVGVYAIAMPESEIVALCLKHSIPTDGYIKNRNMLYRQKCQLTKELYANHKVQGLNELNLRQCYEGDQEWHMRSISRDSAINAERDEFLADIGEYQGAVNN